MAPEQLRGSVAGPATDVYAFGATLTYACNGRRPGVQGPVGEALGALLRRCLS